MFLLLDPMAGRNRALSIKKVVHNGKKTRCGCGTAPSFHLSRLCMRNETRLSQQNSQQWESAHAIRTETNEDNFSQERERVREREEGWVGRLPLVILMQIGQSEGTGSRDLVGDDMIEFACPRPHQQPRTMSTGYLLSPGAGRYPRRPICLVHGRLISRRQIGYPTDIVSRNQFS